MKRNPGMNFAAIAVFLAAVGCGFALHASYPGYLNYDSTDQLGQALTGRFHDWHPPFMALLWSLLLKAFPGPLGMIVFDNLLIWGALAVLAVGLRRSLGRWALLLVAVPLLPGAFNFLGHVHKDALLVALLLGAISTAYLSKQNGISERLRWLFWFLAHLCIVAAFLTRLNAIFALVPLLLYANARFERRWNVALCVAMLILMPLFSKTQSMFLGVEGRSPADSIKTYNLLALSYFSGQNQFPGEWSPENSRQIVESCYTPVQWDVASHAGHPCGFIVRELRQQELWGSPALTRAWLGAIVRNPLGYFRVLCATFKVSVFDPNSRPMLYQATNPWGWGVAEDPARRTTLLARWYVTTSLYDALGRPWFFALLSAGGIALLFTFRAVRTEAGHLSLAVLSSGLIYLLTYFAFNVSAEYRYFYWSGYAAYIGLIVAVLTARGMRRDSRQEDMENGGERVIRFSALGIASLALVLVFVPYGLPTEHRKVTVTPLDSNPIVLMGIHNTATPKWMGRVFEGRVDAANWSKLGNGYQATRADTSLRAELDMLHQSIEVVLGSGPGLGQVLVEEGGFSRVVDTSATRRGILTIIIPPSPNRAVIR